MLFTDLLHMHDDQVSWAWVITLLLLSGNCFAWQSDSVTTTNPSRVRWILRLDARRTIIEKRHINIYRLLTGIGFGPKGHKVTVGYYWLNYGYKQRLIDLRKRLASSINLAYYVKTDVRFVSAAYWYPLYKDKRWTVSVPAELGAGQLSARYRELSGDAHLGVRSYSFIPYQLGFYGEYRLTPWVGMDLQIGYRDALYHGPFRKHFKGPYYSYGLTLYPGKIYKDLKTCLRKKSDE